MTENPKAHEVRLSDDLVAKCTDWAADVVAHYRSGDVLQAMPWTRNQMTEEQCQQWLASRKEAGLKIDINTCELGRWYANDCDPYNLRTDLAEEMYQIGTNRFVRSAESCGWVHEGDLPSDKLKAMYDRIYREYAEYVAAEKKAAASAP
jgi:hypothetical protein